MLAFSCVDRESFKAVARWRRKVEDECGSIPMVLVMTKMDLLYRAAMDSFEVEKLSRSLGVPLIKTSVKENLNVGRVFEQLSSLHLSSLARECSLSSLGQWAAGPTIIQIGGGGRQGGSQEDFLTRWVLAGTGRRTKYGMHSYLFCHI